MKHRARMSHPKLLHLTHVEREAECRVCPVSPTKVYVRLYLVWVTPFRVESVLSSFRFGEWTIPT